MASSLLAVAAALVLAQGKVPVEKAAQIQREQDKAQAEVRAKYGDRKLSELSQEERRSLAQEQSGAEAKVLAKHGVDAKDWARQTQSMNRAEYRDFQDAKKQLDEKEKKEAAEKEKARKAAESQTASAPEPGQVKVQKGISEDKPVVLEDAQPGQVAIEHGLPGEYQEDEQAARSASTEAATP